MLLCSPLLLHLLWCPADFGAETGPAISGPGVLVLGVYVPEGISSLSMFVWLYHEGECWLGARRAEVVEGL